MRAPFLCALVALVAAASVDAQRRGRLRSLRDESAVMAAFDELVQRANPSVVIVRSEGERIALGTVIDADGSIATKASELGDGELFAVIAGEVHPARRIGVDEPDDLALLHVDADEPLQPVTWADAAPRPGAWLVSPDGDGAPAGIGVLSTAPYRHSLERGYLGVQLHPDTPPVRLRTVLDDTAAADAGLAPDDVILAMDGTEVKGSSEFIRAVQAHKPGDRIVLRVQRGEEELEISAELRTDRRGPRSNQEPLWGPLSEVRAGFGVVLQHDTILTPETCGGPLIDLDGHAIGINIARAGRVESLALPAAEVRAAIARIRGR